MKIEKILSELFSVKGILQMIVVAILVFVLFAVTDIIKESNPDNEQLNKTLTNIENGVNEGASWYFVVLSIIGAITLIFGLYRLFVWAAEEFGNYMVV